MKRLAVLWSVLLLAMVSSVAAQGGPTRAVITPENAAQLTEVAVVQRGAFNAIWAIAWSPDSAQLAVVDSQMVWLYSADDWQAAPRRLVGNVGWVRSAVFGPNRLVTGRNDGMVQFWDPVTAKSDALVRTDSDVIHSVAVSSDGALVAAGGHEGEVMVWDVAQETMVWAQTLHDPVPVRTVAFDPAGARLVSGAEDNRLIVWDVATGEPLYELGEEGSDVYSAVFSPDGSLLVAGTARGETLSLYDAASGERLQVLPGQLWEINSVIFSPDGALLVSAGIESESGENRYTVRLRDTVDFAERMRFEAEGVISAVAFSPDGTLLAAAGQDGKVTVWGN